MVIGGSLIEPWQILLLCFGSYRATRFFVDDSLIGGNPSSGSRFSIWLDRFAWTADAAGDDRTWLRGKIGGLASCTYCLGFHVSWIVLCLWLRVWPWQLGVEGWIAACAVAGVQALLNAVDHAL
jgi:hypothetical protein